MSLTSKLIKTGLAGGVSVAALAAANKYLRKKYTSVNKTYEYKAFSWRYAQGKINYIKRGEGRPLLLLHSLSAYGSCYEFSKIIDKLSEKHTVYAIDFPGCGHSDKPEMTYTAFTFVQVIYLFINEVIGEVTDIIASGLSGAYGIMAKRNFCDKIGKIIIADPVSIHSLTSQPTWKDSFIKDIRNLPVTGTFLYNMAASPSGYRLFTNSLSGDSVKDVSRDTSKACCESAQIGGSGGKYLFNSIKSGFVYVDIRKSLKDLEGVSIITDTEDAARKKTASEYRKINKDIKIYEMPGAGHMPYMQDPSGFLAIVGDIL